MSPASAMGLGHLVRPEHMLNPRLRFSEQQRQHYFQGCSSLWGIMLKNPRESMVFQKAYSKLVALPVFLMARMRAVQALSNHKSPSPPNPMQILIQQTSGAHPIRSWADFEAGISAFHGQRAQSSSSEAKMLEASFSSLNLRDKLIEENVTLALTFLGCDIKSTTPIEIQAVWKLLDLEGGTRRELEEYLRLACR